MVNKRTRTNPAEGGFNGLVLIELVIALSLAAALLLGLVQIAAAASASARLQRNQAEVQENARFAFKILARAIRRTGFNPKPWNPVFAPLGIADESQDNITAHSDRLVLRDWSDLNCFDNRNPVVNASGDPAFFVREFAFDLNSGHNLTSQCRYGPALDALTTQVRRQGFVMGVDAFHVQYGLDANQDGAIDDWVHAGEWANPEFVLGIRIGLLLSSHESVVKPAANNYRVLDSTLSKPADGKLRRILRFSAAIRGRTG